ncbi:MAG: phospholipase A, partial [Shewanella sp.]
MSPFYQGIALIGLLTCTGLAAEESLIKDRVKDELATSERPFVITPHKVNYILPVTYNPDPNMDPYAGEAAG